MAIITLIAAVVLMGLSLPDLIFAATHMNDAVWAFGVILPGFMGALGVTAYAYLPASRKDISYFMPRLGSFITDTADGQRTGLWESWVWTILFSAFIPMLAVNLGAWYLVGGVLPIITISGVLLGLLLICRLPLYWMAVLVALEILFLCAYFVAGYANMMSSRLVVGAALGACYLVGRIRSTHTAKR